MLDGVHLFVALHDEYPTLVLHAPHLVALGIDHLTLALSKQCRYLPNERGILLILICDDTLHREEGAL